MNEKKPEHLIAIIKEHNKANRAWEDWIISRYGERDFLLALAEIYFQNRRNNKNG